MKFKTTIEFKSDKFVFYKEQFGIKNNTIRFVNKDEDKKILLMLDDIKYICIINTDNKTYTSSFTRTLKDITRYVNPDDLKIIYIFTWEV